MTQGNSPEPVSSASFPAGQPAPPRRLLWPYRSFWRILFAIFAFEIGVFLAVFPWMDAWALNHFPGFFPRLEEYWDDPYLKGAITGLGCVNLYIAARQLVQLIRRGGKG